MRQACLAAVALICASPLAAQDISVRQAYIPLAPPGVMAHAAYLTLANPGTQTRSLIGVTAEGYGMAHLHQSSEQEGVATMAPVHQIDIAPGQIIALAPGGIHIMLMRPDTRKAAGETAALTLHFANGEDVAAEAVVSPRDSGT